MTACHSWFTQTLIRPPNPSHPFTNDQTRVEPSRAVGSFVVPCVHFLGWECILFLGEPPETVEKQLTPLDSCLGSSNFRLRTTKLCDPWSNPLEPPQRSEGALGWDGTQPGFP